VGVVVVRDGRVLLGLRRGSHGAGDWALPGGHLEWGESVENCARREVKEETGLDLGVVSLGPYTNDVMAAEGKHYVTCFVEAVAFAGEAQVMEPTKCERWAWFDWSAMPDKLFQPLKTLVEGGFVPKNVASRPAGAQMNDQGNPAANRSMANMWAWFRKWWIVINAIYLVALMIAIKIVNGELHGDTSPLFIVLFGILFVSLALDGISRGVIGNLPTMYKGKNPIGFWVVVIMTLFLGCTFFLGGVRSLLGGW